MKSLKINFLRIFEKIGRRTGITKFKIVRKLGRKMSEIFLPEEVEINVGTYSRMIINPKWDTYYLYGYNKLEVSVSNVINKILNEGDVFIDVGAYIGYYSILARESVGDTGKVIAFEPHPENYKRLLKNIRLNSWDNVIAENIALSDKKEKVYLSPFLNSDFTSFSIIPSKGEFVEVEAIPFDEYAKKHNVKPDLIKIDAEGAEFKILKGMKETLQKYHPIIICEIHPQHLSKLGIDVTTLFTYLQEYGYRFSLIKDKPLRLTIEEIVRTCQKELMSEYGSTINPIFLADPIQ